MALDKSAKMKLFQDITGWSRDKMRLNEKAINAICEGGTENAITYDEQNLTEEQQAQARQNIGAGTYSKPDGGIPATDLAEGVIPAIDNAPTSESNNLVKSGGVYSEIHPTIETTQSANGFLPNIFYNLGELTGNITFTLTTPSDATIVNHYYWTFDTGNTAPTITWPNGITWAGGAAPTINSNKHYEISVLNGIGVFMEA